MSNSQKDTDGYLDVSVDDLNMYFSDTYLKASSQKERMAPTYCLIKEFHAAESGGPIVLFRTPGSPIGQEARLRDLQFDFEFPHIGMYNYQKTVLFFQRKTARQNKKGLCNGTALLQPAHEFVNRFEPGVPYDFQMRNQWKWSVPNVVRLFQKQEYTSLEGGFTAVSRCRAFARALSPNFFVAPGVYGASPSLWFRRTLVGEVVSPENIQVTSELFHQEVVDELSRKGVRISAA